jgi:hypothetical protein
LWNRNNDPEQNLIEYQMRVHVFGNNPSPVIATLGLRKVAQKAESKYGRKEGKDIKNTEVNGEKILKI